MTGIAVRKAASMDASYVDALLSEWLEWRPKTGRLRSVAKTIRNGEVLVAQSDSKTFGFIHSVMHEDVIDGGSNCFISAFYVTPMHRNRGAGSLLLEAAISNALHLGAVGVETSTTHSGAKRFYERHHFKQTFGDMGEAFLELDVDELLKERKRTGRKPLQS